MTCFQIFEECVNHQVFSARIIPHPYDSHNTFQDILDEKEYQQMLRDYHQTERKPLNRHERIIWFPSLDGSKYFEVYDWKMDRIKNSWLRSIQHYQLVTTNRVVGNVGNNNNNNNDELKSTTNPFSYDDNNPFGIPQESKDDILDQELVCCYVQNMKPTDLNWVLPNFAVCFFRLLRFHGGETGTFARSIFCQSENSLLMKHVIIPLAQSVCQDIQAKNNKQDLLAKWSTSLVMLFKTDIATWMEQQSTRVDLQTLTRPNYGSIGIYPNPRLPSTQTLSSQLSATSSSTSSSLTCSNFLSDSPLIIPIETITHPSFHMNHFQWYDSSLIINGYIPLKRDGVCRYVYPL